MVNDPSGQPEHVGVLDLAGQQPLEHLMVHRREELLYVGFQDVAEAAGEVLAAVHGRVRALALAASVGVGQEGALVDRPQHPCQGVVDDAVAVRGGADLPRLGLADDERAVRPGLVALRRQLGVQPPQFSLQLEVKAGDIGPEALALACGLGGTEQVLEADQSVPEVADPFHGLWPLFNQAPTRRPISSMAFAAWP
jgi:hypothetical protein